MQMRFDIKPNIIKICIKYVMHKYRKILNEKKDIEVDQDIKISNDCVIKINNFLNIHSLIFIKSIFI